MTRDVQETLKECCLTIVAATYNKMQSVACDQNDVYTMEDVRHIVRKYDRIFYSAFLTVKYILS